MSLEINTYIFWIFLNWKIQLNFNIVKCCKAMRNKKKQQQIICHSREFIFQFSLFLTFTFLWNFFMYFENNEKKVTGKLLFYERLAELVLLDVTRSWKILVLKFYVIQLWRPREFRVFWSKNCCFLDENLRFFEGEIKVFGRKFRVQGVMIIMGHNVSPHTQILYS